MTLYRALRNLSNGVQRGSLTSLPGMGAADIQKLEQVGAVAVVSAPPLDALPAWKDRAQRLSEHGIRDAAQLIEADTDALASAFDVIDSVITLWKGEAADLLIFRKVERGY